MRAAVFDRYGPPGVVQLGEVVRPVPRDNEVLIRVGAASVNPLDCITQGKPYSLRMMTGLRRPRNTRLGVDVAGQVEAAGRDVTQFRPGDQVLGVSSLSHVAGPGPGPASHNLAGACPLPAGWALRWRGLSWRL
jgi:NADPH:quinone reductase-like Zn-dependent oxidoreductase